MASIVRVTVSANVESDILNKEASALVSEAIKQIVPIVVDYIKCESKSADKEAK